MKKYTIKETFGPTIQGEGGMSGIPCHFLRFSGCNMWDGLQAHKAASACPYCDTDFRGGDKLSADEILWRLQLLDGKIEWVTLSGGEPLLQVDAALIRVLSECYKLAVETNGTIARPTNKWFDHVTLSPKVPFAELKLKRCDTLKVLYPHPDPQITPEAYASVVATYRCLQPVDTGDAQSTQANIAATVAKLYELPGWRLSLQIHKYIGVK